MRYLIIFFFIVTSINAQLLTILSDSEVVIPYLNDELVCASTGTAYISSTVAYGEWEYEFYKDGGATVVDVAFISDGVTINYSNDYLVRIKNTEDMYLVKDGSTLMGTAVGFVSLDAWHHVKITRSGSGEFYVYVDEALMSVTQGTNPATDNVYTTNTYFLLDLDTGDKIRNLKINSTDYTDLNSFVGTGTGTFTITDN